MQRGASLAILFLVLVQNAVSQVQVSGSNGTDGTYTSLTRSGGAFSAINSANQSGRTILVTLTGNSTTENGAVSLLQGNWTSLTIFPNGAGRTVSGSANAPLIHLNGADRVTIDGRVNRTGSTPSLTINNTNTRSGAETVRFINSASDNNISYCTVRGSGSGGIRGIITFSTSLSGTGNDNNLIAYNNITGNGASRPRNGIYSSGTAGMENSGNSITGNNLYDLQHRSAASNAIYLVAATTQWTVSGNSFYESASLTPAASVAWYAIRINNTSGTSFTVNGNFIGGSASLCNGTAWTKTAAANNTFYGIYLNVSAVSPSSVDGNTIRNINWSNSLNASFYAITVAGGQVNIGTVSGNTVGANSGTGSLRLTNSTTGGSFYGIRITGSGNVTVANNTIGSVTASNSAANATSVFLISKSNTAGTFTVTGNLAGSLSTPSSVNAASASTANAQSVCAIFNQGTGTVTVSGNTVSNISNSTTNPTVTTAGYIAGIWSSGGINTISGNTVTGLTIANANSQAGNNAALTGILLTGSTRKDVTGNIIANLSNTSAAFAGSVNGLFFTGAASGNTVSGNFVYGLSVLSTASVTVTGLLFSSGTVNAYNNIIELSGSSNGSVYGIWEAGTAGSNSTVLFNTVWIGGTASSAAARSYALYSAASSNTRDFRNNILVNRRNTPGGSSQHYSLWLNYPATSGITLDYNTYYVTGTGGVIGWFAGGNRTTLPIITGGDLRSLIVNPAFTSEGLSVATGYKIGQPLVGQNAGGITSDFGAVARVNPSMGAWEAPVNRWTGANGTSYGNGSNWTVNVPLGNDPDILFSASPLNNCILEGDLSVTNITNPQSAYRLIANGHRLTLKGALNMSAGGQVDVSATGSTLALAGSVSQTLNGNSLYNGTVYNLEVNNPAGIVLSGTVGISNSITTVSGMIDAVSSTPALTFNGNTPQQINSSVFLNERVYNLVCANASGVTINTGFTVTNNLTVSPGAKITVSDPFLLTVSGNIANGAGNGGLILKSSAPGSEAKLINGTAAVPATVELSLQGGNGSLGPAYHYFVPPVALMAIDNSSIEATGASLGLTAFGGDLLAYDESRATTGREAGWQYFDGYNNTTPFNTLEGNRAYNIYLEAGDKLQFRGNLNASDKVFNISFSSTYPYPGWNLIGNPFPCNFDLNGVAALTGSDDGVDNTVYFTADGGYAYWNIITGGTTGYSDIVAPMQGFFVRARASTTVTFPASSKTSSPAMPLRAKSSRQEAQGSEIKKIKLLLKAGDKSDETIVCLIDNATPGFDSDYDAWKFQNTGTGVPSLFSTSGTDKLAINAVPGPAPGEEKVIPLTVVIKTAGTYSISVPEFESLSGTVVKLVHGSGETLLSYGKSYSFTSSAGTFTDFALKFGKLESVGVEDVKIDKIRFWYSNSNLYILPGEELPDGDWRITVYNLSGMKIYDLPHSGVQRGITAAIPLSLSEGVYLVTVSGSKYSYSGRIIAY